MFENESLEKKVVSYLLQDTRFISVSEQFLKPTFFADPKLRRMLKLTLGFYVKWQATLDYDWFKKKIKKAKLTAEEETEFLLLYKELRSQKVDDEKFSFYCDELKDLTIKRGVEKLVDKYGKSLKSDKLDDGEKLVSNLNEDIHNLRIDSNLLTVTKQFVYENVEDRIDEYDARKKLGDIPGIPFGWGKLDQLTGGYFPQELITIFSRTGGGKTRALHNLGYNATIHGRKGLFITIEMSAREICRLYDARLTKLHFLDIKKGKLDEDGELKWKGLIRMMEMKKMQKGFYVVDMPAGCTVESVAQEINEYERRFGKLEFVVVDYLLLMESASKVKNKADLVGDIAKELKKLARRKNVAILTAAQANREAVKQEVQSDVGTEHISISDQIAHHSNVILYLWRSTQDKIKNKLQVKIVKYRDGGDINFELYADWSHNYLGDAVWNVELPEGKVSTPD